MFTEFMENNSSPQPPQPTPQQGPYSGQKRSRLEELALGGTYNIDNSNAPNGPSQCMGNIWGAAMCLSVEDPTTWPQPSEFKTVLKNKKTNRMPPMPKSNLAKITPTHSQHPQQRPHSRPSNPPPKITMPTANDRLTRSLLAAASPGQQKQLIGEQLYPQVKLFLAKPELAGQVTGMLLELENEELLMLIDNDIQLNIKINQAMQVLEHEARKPNYSRTESLPSSSIYLGTCDAADDACQPCYALPYDSSFGEPITVIVDSGACDHVGPPSVYPHLPVQETLASKNQRYFQAANGSRITNLGCKDIQAWTEFDDPIKMRMQVGEGTKRFLGSVLKLTHANCKVVFDDDIPTGGHIIQKQTGQIIPIHKQGSNYVMHLWPEQLDAIPPQEILTGNSTYILDTPPNQPTPTDNDADSDEELLKSTFARLGAKQLR